MSSGLFNAIENITAAMKAPALERVERYMRRVEEHLPTFPNDAERAAFLRREEVKWVERYEAWAQRIDSGNASKGDYELTCWDYIETIAAVRLRREKIEGAKHNG